jgi:hypothetical protein
MSKITKIAHVDTIVGGAVSCCLEDNLDFWKTGTIRANGVGHGTCQPGPNKLHFDIILPSPHGVVAGSKIFIQYENSGGLVKDVTGISVRPPAGPSHAVSFNVAGVRFSSELTISKRRPTSDSKTRYARVPAAVATDDDAPAFLDGPSWLPKIRFNVTVVLFNSFQISASAGDVSRPEQLDVEAEDDRELSPPGPSAPNGGYGAAPGPGTTPS